MRNFHSALWDNTAILNSYMKKYKETGSYVGKEECMKLMEITYLSQIAECLEELVRDKRDR